ncbi:ESX secretion-associated protein EspG [Nocardia terpenica]|uniref:ESX secretion-associated protein EspG n=1 Tax=Nocardia terpenica TaxID=455432 RepID=UPI002FE38A36
MNRTWRFTDIEFFVLWDSLKEGPLPPPLVFTSRTPLHDDFVRELVETQDALRSRVDSSFDEVLEVLLHPDIKIVVDGWDGADADDPKRCVRQYAARKGDRGYVVTQLPGETIWHSGGFVITETEAIALADAVVAALPEAEPGRQSGIVLADADGGDELDYSYGRSAVADSFEESAPGRAARFLRAPAVTIGTIAVVQGWSRFGPRGIVRREIGWRDIEEDGRYAIAPDTSSAVVGVTTDRLRTMINTEIAVVVGAIKDERI